MKVSGTNRRRRLARRKSESYWRKGTDGGGSVLVARNKRPRRIRRRKPESMKDQEYRRLTEFARKLYRDQLAWVGELIGRHIRVSQDGCQYDIAWEGPHAAYKSSRAPSGGLERYEGDADTRPSRADRSESINGAAVAKELGVQSRGFVHLSSDGFRATKSKRLAEEQDPVELPAFTGFNDHIAVADRSRSRIDPVKLEPEKLPAERAELVSADAIRRSRSRTKGEDEANRRRFNEAVENAKRAPAWPLIGNQIPPEDVDKSRLF